jgi:hypothetical protein
MPAGAAGFARPKSQIARVDRDEIAEAAAKTPRAEGGRGREGFTKGEMCGFMAALGVGRGEELAALGYTCYQACTRGLATRYSLWDLHLPQKVRVLILGSIFLFK